MAYAQILQKLLKNFFVTMGRAPVTPKEWAKLRARARELAGETPEITGKTTQADLLSGPHLDTGPKGPRIWDFSKDLPTSDVQGAQILPFRKPPGKKFQKLSGGVEGLLKTGQARFGTAPKTLPATLQRK